jgi:aspartate--ammonia ligase
MTYETSKNYQSILDPMETEKAIKLIKDFFQLNLGEALHLRRVTAPLLVKAGTGINDDLSGVERPISFEIKNMKNTRAEIVQSLAKWKRLALAKHKIGPGEGIYTDMNAIRPDEEIDALHSLYIDQWDWEKVITKEQRSLTFLQESVGRIYRVIRETESFIHTRYPEIRPILPDELTFVHSEELEEKYPELTPAEREDLISEACGAVFIMGIGAALKTGRPHDGRAPDYDDWITPTERGRGLNGDIIVWYPVLGRALELSSMGIRVNRESLLRQLEITGTLEKKSLYFHQKLLREELPLSIGGGIGQSRLCMFYLRKAHIGEVQAGLWPEEMMEECLNKKIFLL